MLDLLLVIVPFALGHGFADLGGAQLLGDLRDLVRSRIGLEGPLLLAAGMTPQSGVAARVVVVQTSFAARNARSNLDNGGYIISAELRVAAQSPRECFNTKFRDDTPHASRC